MPSSDGPDFGTGIYSFPKAAWLLSRREPVGSQTLRYWVHTGLTPATFGRSDSGSLVLSFHDLVSLEVIRLFRRRGVSLQRVRRLETAMRQLYPTMERPFAHEVFFTDGSSIWHQLHPDEDAVLEVVGRRPKQVAWEPAIRSFADEIRYEEGRAVAWDLSDWVEINPAIQFGAPVIKGTRIPVSTIIGDLEVGSPEQVADWHGLEVVQVEDAREHFAAAA